MNPETLHLLAGGMLFVLGWVGTLLPLPALRRILAVNIMGSGVFLVLVAIAAQQPEIPRELPRTMVLVGMLVALGITSIALRLLLRLTRDAGAAAE